MKKLASKVFAFMLALMTTGCSSYKSSWDCPKELGIGCSSVEHADNVAREQIILNSSNPHKEVIINQELPDENYFEEVE